MKLFRFDASEDAVHLASTTLQFFGVYKQSLLDLVRICLLLLIALFIFSSASFCEIRNGYESDIFIMKESLKSLTETLAVNKDLTGVQRRKIESKAELLINHISFYNLTENLLNQLKIIAPKLYAEIDTINDRKGRPVHVYVKFVPIDATKVKAWGVTYLSQMENDKDGYRSEYGDLTVSIKIWVVSKALLVLSHELGHVKYQIPNLASYMDFHKKFYDGDLSNNIGHNPHDPSGKAAVQAEKFFRREYAYYVRNNDVKIQDPVLILAKIRKSMSPKYYARINTWRPTVTL